MQNTAEIVLTLIDFVRAHSAASALIGKARAFLADRGDRTLAQRVAGNAFLIRVFAAGLAYITQVLLARWMGAHEFGVYVYVWTWVMLIGALADLGLASAAQRFIPEYARAARSRICAAFCPAAAGSPSASQPCCAAACAAFVLAFRAFLDDYLLDPALSRLRLPAALRRAACAGRHRALLQLDQSRADAALCAAPGRRHRHDGRAPMLLGAPTDAVTATAVAAVSIWITALGQMVLLNRRLKVEMGPGAKRYEPKTWIAVALPMFMVDSLYSMLTYVDVLVLKQFRIRRTRSRSITPR